MVAMDQLRFNVTLPLYIYSVITNVTMLFACKCELLELKVGCLFGSPPFLFALPAISEEFRVACLRVPERVHSISNKTTVSYISRK